MPKVKVDIPYLAWRDGRPRWVPGPKLRAAGWKGRDLKDDAGAWLAFEAACRAAAAINEEVAGAPRRPRLPPARGRAVVDLLDAYFASPRFARLRPRTQRDYRGKAEAVRYRPRSDRAEARTPEAFGQAPAAAIGEVEVSAFFEYLARARGVAMARGVIMALSAAFKWGRTSPDWRLRHNPCLRLGLPKSPPRVRIASDAEIRSLEAAAAELAMPSIGDAIYLGLFTGQRQGDVLALTDSAGANRSLAARVAEGEAIRFVQSKTGAQVGVFAAPQLVARLAAADARRREGQVVSTAIVVCETTGVAWGDSHFQHSFAKVRAQAASVCPSVATLHFRDLRKTAVTWLARAGCTIPEIADITGHTLKSVYTILKHYLALDGSLARQAIDKLVNWIEKEGIQL